MCVLLPIFMYLVRFLTTTQTWTCIISPIYVYSLIWVLLPFFDWGGYELEPFCLSCTLAWAQSDLGNPVLLVDFNSDIFIMYHASRREIVYYYCIRLLRPRTESTYHRESRRDPNTYSANWSDSR